MSNDFERVVEAGFWRGVARAFEDGMEIDGFLERRDSFLGMLKRTMRGECEGWNPRGTRMATALLTVGGIARNNYEEEPLDDRAIKPYLDSIREIANSATHPPPIMDEESESK